MKMRNPLAILSVVFVACTGNAQELSPAREQADLTGIDRAWSENWTAYLESGEALPFVPPPINSIPDGDFGDMVRDGLRAFMSPATYARDYVGNTLACSNCHLDAGRQAGAAPMWGAYPLYPLYRGKNKQVNTMEMRVQGCFRYSMNGSPPPADSDLMKSYLAYFSWLSQRAPIGVKLQGAGFDTLPDPSIAPDFGRGAQVYEGYCAACHGANGEGLTQADADGWVFPPLWGSNSYNWGAGIHQTDKASAFIKKNMPIGLKNLLTDQQAWDVATYINSQERPQDPRYNGDVQETAKMYHSSPYDLYGSTVNGVVLGADAYPSAQDIVSTSREN